MTDPDNNPHFWQFSGLAEYVAIDLETTGVDAGKDAIIELGAVRFENGAAVDRFSKLVNPLRPLPTFITELTGIKDSDLEPAPPLEDIADSFIKFVGDLPMVGHHFSFDLGFLSAAFTTSDHFDRKRTVPLSHDTSQTCRFIYPCLERYGLTDLTNYFKTDVRSNHRAETDAEATGSLFAKLLISMTGIPLDEIATALRFVEGTASPLANTLRCVRNALVSGYTTDQPLPDPLKGPDAGRENVFIVTGDKRPEEPATAKQIRQLLTTSDRFQAVLPAYEVREEQIGMSTLTAEAFNEGKILIVEAGTGVGKSLGYLIPVLLSGRRIVISTYTKNLQDQLFYDEIPRLGELFKFGFSSALLKGRRNYLCRTKWKTWAMSPERITSPQLREKAALITRWANATRVGDISEISAVRGDQGDGFFYLIASEPGYCRGRGCGENQNCHLMRIRRAAQKADLLIVNHSLVLSDLYSEGGLLGDFGRIVFDEAHHIEDVATDQFGSDLTAAILKATLDRAARLCRKGGELWIRLNADKSLKQQAAAGEKILSDSIELSGAVDNLLSLARSLFQDRMSDEDVYTKSFRYKEGSRVHLALAQAGLPLYEGIEPLRKLLLTILTELEEREKDNFPMELMQDLQGVVSQLGEVRDSLYLSLTLSDSNRVYWVELPPELNRPVRLRSAPLDVAKLLANDLWKRFNSGVLTSATLGTRPDIGGFDHLLSRLGLNDIDSERIMKARFGSPFDYRRNCQVYYPSFLPSPASEYVNHCHQVAEICSDIAKTERRNMLILFTSYDAMRRVENDLKQSLSASGLKVLVQVKKGSNERLVKQFRRAKGAILMGTDSLWEGIDVPGKALQMVVIPRLPFDMPNDPVLAARIERIRAEGGNPFKELQMPAAILRLRQGTGRLIRTSEDRGVVLILDPRAVTKGYGHDFRQAIQGEAVITENVEQLKESIGSFFSAS